MDGSGARLDTASASSSGFLSHRLRAPIRAGDDRLLRWAHHGERWARINLGDRGPFPVALPPRIWTLGIVDSGVFVGLPSPRSSPALLDLVELYLGALNARLPVAGVAARKREGRGPSRWRAAPQHFFFSKVAAIAAARALTPCAARLVDAVRRLSVDPRTSSRLGPLRYGFLPGRVRGGIRVCKPLGPFLGRPPSTLITILETVPARARFGQALTRKAGWLGIFNLIITGQCSFGTPCASPRRHAPG